MSQTKGGFTLPGESGYENLTLKMAEKWGADVIRDSDGTVLSDEIVHAGYGIYSTICIIRDHNEWAKKNTDKLQQTFLCTPAAVAESESVTIGLMDSFFEEQFTVNDSERAMKYWEVYDRTSNTKVDASKWSYAKESGSVTVNGITPFHKYTVSFLAYRIWEEISMYNHTTNNWDKEHLMQIDPRYPETQEYMLGWMKNWCETHPDTTVVRFTSMFYNFVWIWGSDERNRQLFSDWGSYDYTVSDIALDEFEKKYGYAMTAEDFINKGQLHVTHMPGDRKKADWMAFVNDFVISFGRKLIDMVHEYGKKAYVFYDDSWVGVEPYNGRFQEFGFDGLIKCVFSGYEARLCAGVDVPIHELRLHPYLFPVGLGGAPTFAEGGDPTLDAKKYWNSVRRALLRAKIDRIGLGGYLHLVEDFPDFCDYIEKVSDEFRLIRSFHDAGRPYAIKTRVAVLHSWGALRSWTLSGHFHETYMHDLIHINEALSGLPVDVRFISFEDVKKGALADVDVVINAGYAGSAWSGGDNWKDDEMVTALTKWVYEGGTLIGVNEPSAVEGYDHTFRMAHVLGIDEDTGARVCHGKWNFEAGDAEGILPGGATVESKDHLYLTDGKAKVLMADGDKPLVTVNDFGKGKGIYLASFHQNLENTRMLYQLIRYAGGEGTRGLYMTDNLYTECAYYPESGKLVVINNSDTEQTTTIPTDKGDKTVTIAAYDTTFMEL
ncbi:MAG: 1,3-beta-galactosyl-N-acetylhexosamine phosphorylase [Lachnospiraceae bacterium]|nr:1,3-beta-galactosyl-N-acetylhexosamine phosphorylase [Lachnospiraceae bacterium]MCM1240428.1 1,3-beta-galactosyl-N-acetylhexosamine phosphorylase [Lachnospiraceae bacterium]MCM1303121.1 1,3-beta-galactosyl-N-acetylhexosamine phosphorylase [Butyrivibrio sp.]MCM1342790.1 1,3-beta-galactosyl-N-acetylhexosamine phosphorylase [Muribaculaceae bacterium]MCM1409946.1 1,3-beta-galactosyl-N-acetylhexosamine phosphorylase [Lachnospiraceae bacterium]